MANNNERSAKKAGKNLLKEEEYINGILGNGAGVVSIPGYQNLVRARVGDRKVPVILKNVTVTHSNDLKIVLRKQRKNKHKHEVEGVLYDGQGDTNIPNGSVGMHANQHFLTGPDPVWIDTWQIINLGTYSPGGLTVTVYPGIVLLGTGFYHFPGASVDMSAYAPAAGLAKWCLLQISTTGTLNVKEGAEVDFLAITLNNIPSPDTGCKRLSAVRLYDGQTTLSMNPTASDIIDLRWDGGNSNAGGGHIVEEETTALTNRAKLSFQGSGVTATDNPANDRTIVTIPGKHTVEEETTPLTSRSKLSFQGAGVTATDDAGNDRTIVTIPGGGTGHTIEDETTPLTARSKLSFQGAGVTATDDAGNDRTIVTIPSGGTPDAADVTFTPAVLTDWNTDTDPGNVDDALDQLAARTDDLENAATHSAVTLDADAATILDLTGQEIGLDVQNANKVLAGPSTGVDNEPTFRALVAADVGTGTPTGSKYLRDDMSWQTTPGGTDDAAIHDNVANEIAPLTGKTTLALADKFLIEDSAASWAKKETDVDSILQTRLLDTNVTYYVAKTGSDSNPGTSGSPFLTIGKAVSMFYGKTVKDCVISIGAGTYTEEVNISGISASMFNGLKLQGQTGCYVNGLTYMYNDTTATYINDTYEGVGTVAIWTDNMGTGSRLRIACTRTTTNPNWISAGVTTANRVLLWDGTTLYNYAIYSVDAGNVITLDTTATRTINVNGRFFTFLPSVMIEQTTGAEKCALQVFNSGVECQGIYFNGYYGGVRLYMSNCMIYECVVNHTYTGNYYGGVLTAGPAHFFARYDPFNDAPISVFGHYAAASAGMGATLNIGNCFIHARGSYGAVASGNSQMYFNGGRCGVGTYTGVRAQNGGYIMAASTVAKNYASTQYSPSVSDTNGNSMAAITFT